MAFAASLAILQKDAAEVGCLSGGHASTILRANRLRAQGRINGPADPGSLARVDPLIHGPGHAARFTLRIAPRAFAASNL